MHAPTAVGRVGSAAAHVLRMREAPAAPVIRAPSVEIVSQRMPVGVSFRSTSADWCEFITNAPSRPSLSQTIHVAPAPRVSG